MRYIMGKSISILCMAGSVIMMLNRYSAFVPSPSGIFTPFLHKTSYFDINNSNPFPFIVAVMSVVVLVMLIIRVIRSVKKENDKLHTVLVCSCLSFCVLASLLSWVVYPNFIWGVTEALVIQGIILFLHVSALASSIAFRKPSRKCPKCQTRRQC